MEFGQLWLPWTEHPDDLQARLIRKQRVLRILGLKALVELLPQRYKSDAVEAMLDFYGVRGSVEKGNAKIESELAIETARTEFVPEPRRHFYWHGGDSVELPGTNGVRIFFLGPMCESASPSGVFNVPAATSEKRLAVNEESGQLIAAITRRIGRNRVPAFLKDFDIKESEAKEMQDLSAPFGETWKQPYEADADTIERLDAGELGGVMELAVKLDQATNASSLAMAVELPRSKKVLLLPGDAPAADWKDWQKWTWPVGPSESDSAKRISGRDLLGRAVLYKVSQNGCAKGTSAAEGLSLLACDLVALLSVDGATARARGWDIPFSRLLEALRAKTNDRLIRSDEKRSASAEYDVNPSRLIGPRFVKLSVLDRPAAS